MSKLDRAFIRAFNRERTAHVAEPQHALECSAPVAPEDFAPPVLDTTEECCADAGTGEPGVQDPHLPSIEELYGFPRTSGESRILRADGPVARQRSIPTPHTHFASNEEVAPATTESEPVAEDFEGHLTSAVFASTAPAGELPSHEETTAQPAAMRLFFGEDTPHVEEAMPAEGTGQHPRSRPTLSLYRESSWDETWDAESFERGGLFGETSEEPPAAAFEVPRFAWPAMCDTLIRNAEGLFESLADALVAAGHDGHNRVVFTGTCSGAGCTTIALAVARRLAADGHSVVLVDANWRHPQLAARLGMRPECGWREIVEERLPVDEALVESRDDRLSLLPLVERSDAPTAGLDAAALANHVARLGRHYDLVLIDAGALDAAPAVGFELTAHLVNLADVAILVQDMRAKQQESERLQEALDRAGLAWWGTVENFVPAA
ncbi:MAG: hypothetical protein KF708_03000 [Pirellulales bacterium]|nr:hypothetical protein [Pirellulales bacterium]